MMTRVVDSVRALCYFQVALVKQTIVLKSKATVLYTGKYIDKSKYKNEESTSAAEKESNRPNNQR